MLFYLFVPLLQFAPFAIKKIKKKQTRLLILFIDLVMLLAATSSLVFLTILSFIA